MSASGGRGRCTGYWLAATIWALFFFAVLYVPWLIEFAGDDLRQRWLKGGLTLGWLMHFHRRAVAGRSPSTGNDKRNTSKLKEAACSSRPVGVRRRPAVRHRRYSWIAVVDVHAAAARRIPQSLGRGRFGHPVILAAISLVSGLVRPT